MLTARLLLLARDVSLSAATFEALGPSGIEWVTEDGRGPERIEEAPWDVVIADRSAAETVLAGAARSDEPPEVILLDSFGSVSDAVHDIERGAFDCIAMPAPAEQLVLVVHRALAARRLARENKSLRAGLERQFALDKMLSRDPHMHRVFDVVRSVADTKANILIEGESGTGKTMLARTVHQHSTRAFGPFVHVNCGAIPESLLESELFGHVKGAFTGAVRDRLGKFEAAAGGTIFLDEIATASHELQVKLLRVIEDGLFERVGDTSTRHSDARLVAASNRELEREVAEGRFREDLYYRINVVRIVVPPLRERPGDIQLLARHFLAQYVAEHERQLEGFEPEALQALLAHAWSGNVRQLQHAIERAVLLAPGKWIAPRDLGPDFAGTPAEPELGARLQLPLGPLKQALEGPERSIILRGLQHFGGNRKATAELLGINRTTLFNKMKKYDLLSFPTRTASREDEPDATFGPSAA